jgi:hypothetical protein
MSVVPLDVCLRQHFSDWTPSPTPVQLASITIARSCLRRQGHAISNIKYRKMFNIENVKSLSNIFIEAMQLTKKIKLKRVYLCD